ncbi:pyridoxamine 5'-phosphate oxidase family protein [Geomicrobium sediminis]|uniref:General stress protein 26 n=1 Tax=Geomicrobium sediminis TaxID=1347788 RepID=A0ABS2P822_9BACL|nr:pyridoxamine 5'-phosphate oxidase family protein [Geomicrobium sediminis]MBM7631467.1 general stress protein 26 [Geomicrobium sediminis]
MSNHEQLKEHVIEVLKENRIGVLSTMKDDRPYARYMTFYHDGLMLYTPTGRHTHKVEDIEENAHVHILLGYDEKNDSFVEIEATATIVTDATEKQKAWSEKVAEKYSGPEDEEFVVLALKPSVIRYKNDEEFDTPQELRL